ncbi:acyl-CoA dehydrogenase family protein [Catellatospora citrea]|uniref:acyl-CoA dehydrogenase family protein n=1 Tax=Catellatospora citrea TaxID=53366 RepID=UPI0033E0973B
MPTTEPDLAEPATAALSARVLHERAAPVLAQIRAGAADRERLRELPYDQVRAVAKAQLFAFRIPEEHDGAGASVRDTIRFVIDLAAADSNVAQALRPDFSFVEGLVAQGSDAERKTWFCRLLAGQVVGNAGWEIGGANGAISARITREGAHYRASGSKYYSTGSLFADWVSATALDDDGQPVSFIVPRDREGLRLHDDFDAVGQRLTASGTTDLDGLVVHPHELRDRRGFRDRRSPVTAFLQLYLGAVLAGIARDALRDATAFARDRARPIKHSTAARAVDDPYVRLAVGEIAARAYAAEAVVLAAAQAIDDAWAADLAEDALVRASVEVAQAQYVAADAALRAGELVFDVGGGSATARGHNLDRHWRNARTVANHNPRLWKAAAAGAYHLTGEQPPLSGLF